MAVRACISEFQRRFGRPHSVDVDAETVYEAGIRGAALLRKDGWTDVVGTGAELEIPIREPETTHKVTIGQLRSWCDGVSVSPAETLRKAKLTQLLESL